MLLDTSLQKLANLIQAYEIAESLAASLYDDPKLKDWSKWNHSLATKLKIAEVKKKIKLEAGIDYDSDEAKSKVIKEGSLVQVLVGHMPGMKGGTAVVKSYSLPAMLSDVTMTDGMIMPDHKWLVNSEVKL